MSDGPDHTPSATKDGTSPWPEPLPVCWCITNGRPAMVTQTVGLAEAMGLAPIMKRVVLRKPWAIVSPYLMPWKSRAFSHDSDRLAPPWPDLVIATGRTSIMAALYVKEQTGGRAFTVLLQDPVAARRRFDRIVIPAHDGVRGDNVIEIDGAPHRLTSACLGVEADYWRERFAHLPERRIAVLLGGNNSRYRLGQPEIEALSRQLVRLSEQGFGLMITPSRRTGEAEIMALRTALADRPAYIWDGSGDNPYFAMLGSAYAVIVTCDSVNMISEACSTGKPVYVIQLPAKGWRNAISQNKFARFHTKLKRDERIRFFNGEIETWAYKPLREMERIALLVRRAYLKR